MKRFLLGGLEEILRSLGLIITIYSPLMSKFHQLYTALCWKENLSLDRPCESINKLSISLQIQVEDLIHFKGNVPK